MQHYICRKLNVQTTNFGEKKTLQPIEIVLNVVQTWKFDITKNIEKKLQIDF